MSEVTYVPVDPGGFRLAMGLRPLDPARWLEVDGARREELAEKYRLLIDVPDRVVAALPGSEVAAAELLAALLANLAQHHPGVVTLRSDGIIEDLATGYEVDPRGLHPLDTAGRLVQEDLCLLEQRAESWILTAASVCFPSRWALQSKLGQRLSVIHQPVPGYEEALATPVDAFFDRLRPERPVWRLNWTLVERPELHLPDPPSAESTATPLDPGRDLWFRVERQTLRRITDRPAITFTIRTYVSRLDALCDAHPEVVEALRANLVTAPAATVAYKGWGRLLRPLLTWLDARR